MRSDRGPSPANVEKETSAKVSNGKLPFPGYQRKSPYPDDSEIPVIVVSYSNYRDPLIHVNRAIFKFNDVTYRYLLIPMANGYRRITPDSVEKCIGNFFHNIKTPIYAVNHLLQGKPKPMGRTLLRFGYNSTIGLLGFFDPAKSKFHIKREETHFENTLARYKVGYGFYLVIPILGPSDLRRGAGSIVDGFLNPIPYFVEFPWSLAIQGFDSFQFFAPNAKRYTLLRRKSEDPYIFFRNLYLQGVQRDADY
jgi:phospholipid-binding lipoprotein MlaA